jgi:hypothetical protein
MRDAPRHAGGCQHVTPEACLRQNAIEGERNGSHRDPGAHGATAPILPFAHGASVRGAQASRRMPAPAA